MPPQVLAYGKNILGYVVVGTAGLLLLAERLRTSAVMPGGHEVKTVTASKWHKLPLPAHSLHGDLALLAPQAARSLREEMERGVDKITSFPVDGECTTREPNEVGGAIEPPRCRCELFGGRKICACPPGGGARSTSGR